MATSTTNHYTQTILSGGQYSPGGRLDRLVPVGLVFPANWSGSSLQIEVSLDGVAWLSLPTEIGTYNGAANRYQPLEPAFFVGMNYYRLYAPTPVAADTDVIIVGVDI